MRRAFVALVVVVTVLGSPAVAGALGTSQFTIDPAPGARTDPSTDRLIVTPKRGGSSQTSVLLTNRLDRPLELRLEVEPITLTASGSASLGGDGRAVDWVQLERERVVLGPHRSAIVSAKIRVPRGASEMEQTIGILAEPLAEQGSPAPSVIQRLALVVYIRPHGTAPRPIVLIAVAVTMVLVVLVTIILLAPRLDRRRG